MSLRQGAYVLLLATLILAVIGEWLPGGLTAAAWCLPAGVLLLGLAYERLETARLATRLRIDAPRRWVLARPQPLTLQLDQARFRAHRYQLAPQAPEGVDWDVQVRDLAADDSGQANLALTAVPRRLGSHAWPEQRARVAGVLGLAWWSLRLSSGAQFQVVPDTLLLRERAPGLARGDRARVSRRSGSGTQADQLRDHRQGDPLRIIDWKATARRRELTSRDFVDEQHIDIILALDVGRSSGVWCGELDRLGHYVNVAARFTEHAVGQGDRVGLVLYAQRPLVALPPAAGMRAVRQIRAALAAAEPRSVDANPLPAAARIRTLARQRSLVLLLTDIDDAASSSQLVGAVRLLQPKHLPLVAGLASAVLAGYTQRAANDWLDPYLSLAAQLGREQRERSIRALRALGAPALVTRPETLEREVLAIYSEFRARHRL